MKYNKLSKAAVALLIILPIQILFIPFVLLITLVFCGVHSTINSFKDIIQHPFDECEIFLQQKA